VCGIAGAAFGLVGREEIVRRMTAALAHRGPDGEGFFSDEHVALGHRRLAILDLTPAGAQPMQGARAWITYNGELYNHAELRASLEARGHRFRSRSDTEVVLRLWEEEGDGCLARLRGMFALAIWDPAARRLLLARDHFGQKPLFWARRGEALLFASEIKALAPHVSREIDPRGVDAFLSLGVVPAPLTCLAGIHRLPPAAALVFEPGGAPRVHRYWEPAAPTPRGRGLTDDEAAEEVEVQLARAVREQLVADVPVGVLLSGGIDSSLILAAAGRPLTAFSIGFREPELDELPHARRVAAALGAEHVTAVITADDARDPARLVALFDEPFADVAALPVVALARLARPRVKVVLTGDGGDEAFGGYPHHLAAAWLARLPPAGGLARAALRVTPRPVAFRSRLGTLRRVLEALAYGAPALRANLSPDERVRLLDPALGAEGSYDLLEPTRPVHPAGDPVLADRFLYKTDVALMSAGVEGRSPFLDLPLVELAASLPASRHLGALRGKRILRDLAARRLGPDVASRRKTGLSMPVGAWLRGPLAPLLAETLLAPGARVRDYVRPREVARLVAEHLAGRADHRRALWPLLLLELWLRTRADLYSPA
jgi:asparagine synthase (glutamine-hydrolysing)